MKPARPERWTADPPTAAGHYWVRRDGEADRAPLLLRLAVPFPEGSRSPFAGQLFADWGAADRMPLQRFTQQHPLALWWPHAVLPAAMDLPAEPIDWAARGYVPGATVRYEHDHAHDDAIILAVHENGAMDVERTNRDGTKTRYGWSARVCRVVAPPPKP